MTIQRWLDVTTNLLQKQSIPTAKLDAELLLADEIENERSWLLAHPEFELSKEQLENLNKQIKRRVKHEPIAYIRGKQEFYGREFYVSPDTLTPRPETETMVELLLEQFSDGRQVKGDEKQQIQIVDVGTGSGCIIISVALEMQKQGALGNKKNVDYVGLDISEKALKIAKKNADKYNIEVTFEQFDLLSQPITPHLSPVTYILANLPYVPNDFKINLATTHEPALAIYGGDDGLDYYRALFKSIPDTNNNYRIFIYTESLPPQHVELSNIAKSNSFKLIETKDFIQIFSH